MGRISEKLVLPQLEQIASVLLGYPRGACEYKDVEKFTRRMIAANALYKVATALLARAETDGVCANDVIITGHYREQLREAIRLAE